MSNVLVAPTVMVIQPQGCIKAHHAVEWQYRILLEVSTSPCFSTLLVDLSNVNYLDNEGLMVLVAIYRLVRRQKLRLSFGSVSPEIRMIFELSQLDKVFEFYEPRATSEAAFAPEKDSSRHCLNT